MVSAPRLSFPSWSRHSCWSVMSACLTRSPLHVLPGPPTSALHNANCAEHGPCAACWRALTPASTQSLDPEP